MPMDTDYQNTPEGAPAEEQQSNGLFGPDVDKKQKSPLCVSGKTLEHMRNYWGKKCNARRDFMRNETTKEIKRYLKVYRNELDGLLPGYSRKDRIDVNIIFPAIRQLVPQLYYKDPKVAIEAIEKEFKFETPKTIVGDDGTEYPDPGVPGGVLVETVDGPRAAALLSGAINRNILAAKAKKENKMAIQDAMVCHYGAIKLGWDNEQGVYDMAPGEAPPSSNSSIQKGMAYGIRMKPWDVLVDDANFYNPQWVAFRWAVNPWNLKVDKRLKNTEALKGNCSEANERWLGAPTKEENSEPLTEYYELYHRPNAEYPKGFYMIITDEVREDFLFLSEFPTEKTTELPVSLIYFNPDPEGGLPIPEMRYTIDQQRAKMNLRNIEYDYVKRTLPIMVVAKQELVDEQNALAKLQSGIIPRVLLAKNEASKLANGVSFNNLNFDFRQFDKNIDDDFSRTLQMLAGAGPAGVADVQLAEIAKVGQRAESITIGEKADIVREFLTTAVNYWVCLYQEYSSEQMSAPVEDPSGIFKGQDLKYPITFSWKDIRGKFIVKIKPFSNNYEDPVILRRQITDRMNLMASPQVAETLKRKGLMYDMERDLKSLLETYDDRNVDQLLIPYQPTQEELLAIEQQKNSVASGMAGTETPFRPTVGPAFKSGGGNKEGLPINGSAVNQEMMRQPIEPNSNKSAASFEREATNTR